MKRKIFFTALLLPAILSAFAQQDQNQNSADKLLASDNRLTIGGYAQIDYNQPLGSNRSTGELDVHRLVMLFGYKFDKRTSFITELEFEHVRELYVEQAFLQYRIHNNINFRGGLMLVPMGLINETHEPPSFNGVERPLIDKYIAPSTWREIGLGFTGTLPLQSFKYQLYIFNGFNGYNDGISPLNGSNGLRKGRQKGAESFISSPNFAFRTEYFGIRSLSLGLSGYLGKTQSSLADGLNTDNTGDVTAYDSSRVNISMIGIDAKYSRAAFRLRGQYYFTSIANTEEYNSFTAADGTHNDLGSSMTGYYIELAYDLLSGSGTTDKELLPFIRYEYYNTHNSTEGPLEPNDDYRRKIITTGLTYKLTPGAVLKADMQFSRSAASDYYSKTLNMGIGVMF